MIPLHVAVIIRHKVHLRERESRIVGPWSYPVEQFTWDFVELGRKFKTPLSKFKNYDLVFLEDGLFGEFTGEGCPVVSYVIDSTVSQQHYMDRLDQAHRMDLVLVDHDRLARFHVSRSGRDAVRWSYCANDVLFRDRMRERSVDVGFYANIKGEARSRACQVLEDHCKRKGYSYALGPVIGDVQAYPKSFNQTKININISQWPGNRPHRVMDCWAARGCLLTSELPIVSDEPRLRGHHYIEFKTMNGMTAGIDYLLRSGQYQDIADHGYELSKSHYSWHAQAANLRNILARELGL